MHLPEVEIKTIHYYPDSSQEAVETEINTFEDHLMDVCMDNAYEALLSGNPPVAAALKNNDTGMIWLSRTEDKTTKYLRGHAEQKVYDQASEYLGENMSNCTLLSTVQLCTSCTPYYAEGKIGKIITAAPRSSVYEVAGIMRPRKINMPELLADGNTDTIATYGYRAKEALELFSMYALLRSCKRVDVAAKYNIQDSNLRISI